nr:sigma-E processing peptidase SpoIIGA [Caldicellulosiruptor acetigenus]
MSILSAFAVFILSDWKNNCFSFFCLSYLFTKKLFWIYQTVSQFLPCFTIMFGGMGFFLYYISQNSIEYSAQLKLKNVLLALGISLIVFKLSHELIIKKVYKDSLIRYIKFKINDSEYSCVGYVDTGNNLREPFSGKPVVIVEKSFLRWVKMRKISVQKTLKNFRSFWETELF